MRVTDHQMWQKTHTNADEMWFLRQMQQMSYHDKIMDDEVLLYTNRGQYKALKQARLSGHIMTRDRIENKHNVVTTRKIEWKIRKGKQHVNNPDGIAARLHVMNYTDLASHRERTRKMYRHDRQLHDKAPEREEEESAKKKKKRTLWLYIGYGIAFQHLSQIFDEHGKLVYLSNFWHFFDPSPLLPPLSTCLTLYYMYSLSLWPGRLSGVLVQYETHTYKFM